jgi:hypothetical protein
VRQGEAPGGDVAFRGEPVVLVEGECWESTPLRSTKELHSLGFPVLGHPVYDVRNGITITTDEVTTVVDYLPSSSVVSRFLCLARAAASDLPSYECAVLGQCDSDSDASESDMSLSSV